MSELAAFLYPAVLVSLEAAPLVELCLLPTVFDIGYFKAGVPNPP